MVDFDMYIKPEPGHFPYQVQCERPDGGYDTIACATLIDAAVGAFEAACRHLNGEITLQSGARVLRSRDRMQGDATVKPG
jgi:hypothetical protein